MASSVESSPNLFQSLPLSMFTAYEETFTLINPREKKAVTFDFERRRVNSRCIIRVIDFEEKTVSETRSRTLRFNIKSTFAPLPFEDEAITFTGGGFTASVVTKDNTYRIISAAPEMKLSSSVTGFKAKLSFSLNPGGTSFNQLYRKGRYTEAIHSSLSPSASGIAIIGGKKMEIKEEEHIACRVWKSTTFPIRRDTYSSYCYGRTDRIFSFTLSLADEKCITLIEDRLKIWSGVKMVKQNEEEYIFRDGSQVEIYFTVFSTITEKTSPFRKNRTLKYGLFSGCIADFPFPSSFGCIEL